MENFSTYGLLLQLMFVFVSNVYGMGVNQAYFYEADEELSQTAAENTKEIFDYINRPSILAFDYLIDGAETLMLYLNYHTNFEAGSIDQWKNDISFAINTMKDEMQKCFKAYNEVAQNIADKIVTGKKPTDRDFSAEVHDLRAMNHVLISSKRQYLNVCAPYAFTAATEGLKNKVFAVFESKELHRQYSSLGRGETDATEIAGNIQKQIGSFLAELDQDAAKAHEFITVYRGGLFRSMSIGKYNTARNEYKKAVDQCNQTAKEMFKENWNVPLLQRLSMTKKLCEVLYSPKCKIVYSNMVTPLLEALQAMLDKKKSEVKSLFQICVDGALLEKTQHMR